MNSNVGSYFSLGLGAAKCGQREQIRAITMHFTLNVVHVIWNVHVHVHVNGLCSLNNRDTGTVTKSGMAYYLHYHVVLCTPSQLQCLYSVHS